MQVISERQFEPRASAQSLPTHPTTLTLALQGVLPLTLDFVADPAQLAATVVQGEVLVKAAQHHREMTLLFASPPMPVLSNHSRARARNFRQLLVLGMRIRANRPSDPPHRHA